MSEQLDRPDNSRDDDYDDGMEPDCLICGGECYLPGEDLDEGDFWYDLDKMYPCPSCGGTGLARDMRYC